MFVPADAMLYFYLLVGMGYVDVNNTNNIEYSYKPYTTHHIITNNDMYNIDEIITITFKEE